MVVKTMTNKALEYCYKAIKEFTGFDLRNWLNENAQWQDDISEGFRKHLEQNDLLKYLTWQYMYSTLS